MREGELAVFWVDARLVQAFTETHLWWQDGYECVEEGYEWEVEVVALGPARISPTSGLVLKGGLCMPRLGLGLYMVRPDDAYRASLEALQLGYRLLDTASMYQNEASVGRALRDSGVARADAVVVSKVNNPDHGYHEALAAVRRSLEQLGLDRVDVMLIHSPIGGRLLETWDALLEARRRGWATQVGVSNFGIRHLQALQAAGRELPAVNQFELSPFCQEPALRRFCEEQGIVVMGYSPLTRGTRLSDARVGAVAARHRRTPAQVMLRWALQQGVAAIPKTTSRARLQENLGALDFELSPEDLSALAACEERLHTCWDCLDIPWEG